MGINIKSKLIRRGYYPKGGGEAILTINPIKIIKPLNINEKQEFREINGIINIANLPEHISTRMKHASIKKIIENNLKASIKIESTNSFSPGTGITLWSRSKNTIMGKTRIGERGVSAENIGENIVSSLINEIKSGSTIDINSIDQIIPYMFLANYNEPSICSVLDLSGHTMTNIWLLNHFIKNKNILKIKEENNLKNIEVYGINYFKK
jgi:RNA 3'-phosphate cyclase